MVRHAAQTPLPSVDFSVIGLSIRPWSLVRGTEALERVSSRRV